MEKMAFGKLDVHSEEDIKAMEEALKMKIQNEKIKEKKDDTKKSLHSI